MYNNSKITGYILLHVRWTRKHCCRHPVAFHSVKALLCFIALHHFKISNAELTVNITLAKFLFLKMHELYSWKNLLLFKNTPRSRSNWKPRCITLSCGIFGMKNMISASIKPTFNVNVRTFEGISFVKTPANAW